MKKKIIKYLFMVVCLLLSNSIYKNNTQYLGWIFEGTTTKPVTFPKDGSTHSIKRIECGEKTTAVWDPTTKKAIITPTSSSEQCLIYVGDKVDTPITEPVNQFEAVKAQLEAQKASYQSALATQQQNKNTIATAINAASGGLNYTGQSFSYLGEYIKKSLYVYPTSVSQQKSAILQQKSTSGSVTFSVPFKSTPSVSKSVSNQYSGMSCSGSVSNVTRFGYTWSLSNSSNRNGTCYLNITFTQP